MTKKVRSVILSKTARLSLHTAWGREIEWRANAFAGEDGSAIIRVPYATDGGDARSEIRVAGLYRVRVGGGEWAVSVSEESVREGGRIRVGLSVVRYDGC